MEVLPLNLERLEAFKKLGDEHFIFACHAAVPLIFSIDLLDKLLTNFSTFNSGATVNKRKIPYHVVSDLVLSSFVKPVGYQLYKMEDDIRLYLQDALIENFGKIRQIEIASFLKQYADKHYTLSEQNIRDIHVFSAEALLDPENMQKKLAEKIGLVNEDYEKINYLTLYFNLSREETQANPGTSYITLVSEDNPNAEGVIKLPLSKFLLSKVQQTPLAQQTPEILSDAQQQVITLIRQCFRNRSKSLDLGNCGLRDHDFENNSVIDDALRSCTHLTTLILGNVWWDNRRNIPAFSSNKGKANFLSKLPNTLTALRDLETLISCGDSPKDSWGIKDLSPLKYLPRLVTLDLSFNRITSLSALSGNYGIKNLYLVANQIRTISPLSDFKDLVEINLSSNQIKTIIPLARHDKITKLFLENNAISDMISLANMTSLAIVNLRNNNLQKISYLGKLNKLKRFYAGNNKIKSLSGLDTLIDLDRLDLSRNEIESISPLERLVGLTELDIANNQIKNIGILTDLLRLSVLNLSGNRIENISPLASLVLLRKLQLDRNRIQSITGLAELKNLTNLNLSDNLIKSISPIAQLKELEELYLDKNQIRSVKVLSNLISLTKLTLSQNELQTMGPLNSLASLKFLDLRENQISSITGVEKLTGLEFLDLRQNVIRDLRPLLPLMINSSSPLPIITDKESHLEKGVLVEGNPVITPPVEIANQGTNAVLSYFQNLEKQGTDYLYEGKVILLGPPAAGKTTLVNRLVSKTDFIREKTVTRGIEITQLNFDITNKDGTHREFYYNLWDFGGQEIYYSLHQVFFTQGALYILVLDSTHEGEFEDNESLNNWLQSVALFAEGGPLLLVFNEKNGRKLSIDLSNLNARYYFIKGSFNIDLSASSTPNVDHNHRHSDDFSNLKEAIETELMRLPNVGAPMPHNWISIRERLRASSQNYVYWGEYVKICIECGLHSDKEQRELCRIFQDLGVFLHFQGSATVNELIILQPEWLLDAMYGVFNDHKIIENNGKFYPRDLVDIWRRKNYDSAIFNMLLALMVKFELCFPIDSEDHTPYVIPELLPNSAPSWYKWNNENDFAYFYKFDFMPKGMMAKIVARFHHLAKEQLDQRAVWRNGISISGDKLSFPDTTAEIVQGWENKELWIRVSGKHEGEVLKQLSIAVEDVIHQFLPESNTKKSGFFIEWHKMLPCNCPTCRRTQDKTFYDYNNLLNRKQNGQITVECSKEPYYNVRIEDIINSFENTDDIDSAAAFVEHRPHSSSEHTPTSNYVVIVNDKEIGGHFSTQSGAKNYACNNGYRPVHVARQRHLQDRTQPAHWRSEPC